MNVGESIDVNTLLRYLLRLERRAGEATSEDSALDAACRLIALASKRLDAGLRPEEVRVAWCANPPRPSRRPRGKRGKS